MWVAAWIVSWCVLCVGGGSLRAGDVRLWERGGVLRYRLETAALLNEPARADRPVGWRVAATLAVRVVSCSPEETTLQLQLESPVLTLRGAHPRDEWVSRPSVWDAPGARAPFHVAWRAGAVRARLPPAPAAVQDYWRGLASLLQILDGERNETDVSGECTVLYETIDQNQFRKMKRECGGEGAGGVTSRRVTRYSLAAGGDVITELHAEETHSLDALGEGGGAGAGGVRARLWTRWTLAEDTRGGRCGPAEGEGGGDDGMRDTPLYVPAEEEEDEEWEQELDLKSALESSGALLGEGTSAGEGGEGEEGTAGDEDAAARALLRLLPALQAANLTTLRAELREYSHKHPEHLVSLSWVVGAAGTEAALQGGWEELAGRGEHRAAGAALLGGAGGAASLQPGAARRLRALAGKGPLRGAALLAVGAARAGPEHAAAARKLILQSLNECKDDDCREIALLALGNLQQPDTTTVLLQHATTGAGRAARAALRGLAALAGAGALHPGAVRTLQAIVLDDSRALAERAAALDATVLQQPGDYSLLEVDRLLLWEGGVGGELRALLWTRLRERESRPGVKELLSAMSSDRELGSWWGRALSSCSHVLRRAAGGSETAHDASLTARTVSARGLLHETDVTLQWRGGSVLGVTLWARGVAAVTGGGEGEEEELAAGLLLSVRGAVLPPVTLFTGQAELLGLVWSGAGSEPVSVMRAAGGEVRRGGLVTLAGGSLRWRRVRVGVLALDASGVVSLWSRTASARLDLRGGAAWRGGLVMNTAWGVVRGDVISSAPGRLRLAADLDFYSEPALCVRCHVTSLHRRRDVTLHSQLGARRWSVSRSRHHAAPLPPRTLRLSSLNDVHCRALTPRD